MIPALAGARYIRAFSRVRPLLQPSGTTDRAATRGFALLDHASQGVDNFCTITGGKLTTCRLMAERTADLVARRLGNDRAGLTATVPLPDDEASSWADPAAAPKRWHHDRDPDDMILCECEMVPQSAIEQVFANSPDIEKERTIDLIALRTRAGKGPCQGSFCGIRILRDFLDERFKGQRSVIWGPQAAQMELAEALHCGLLGLDTLEDE